MTKKDTKESTKESALVQHFTSKTWKQNVLEAELPVLVDFTATWCGPCKAIAPLIAEIAEEREGTVKVGKLDIDKNESIADQYGVQGIPTLLVFVKGEVVGQAVGSMPKKHINELLDAAIKGQRPGMPKKKKG